jgi:2-hydroxy-6-oxo-6-(2'-aminophenyl)hexa-2,4-dienoate hydrolase
MNTTDDRATAFGRAALQYESKFLNAGGLSTHYIDAGKGEPVVLLHGGGAGADCRSNWFKTIPQFANRFHVYAVDLLGFGHSARPDPASFAYTQDARIDHLIAAIEALDVGPVHMVGNSMGGATTIGVAVKRPDLVKKVVLMGSGGLTSGPMSPALGAIVNYDFTRDGMVKVCQALANPTFDIDPAMVDYRLQLSIEPATRAAYSATMGWVKSQGGLHYEHDFIRRIQAPTLVVNGKDDKVVPLSNALTFLELIDNSWAYIIPHCGHWAMLEYPDDFAGAVTRFLSGMAG